MYIYIYTCITLYTHAPGGEKKREAEYDGPSEREAGMLFSMHSRPDNSAMTAPSTNPAKCHGIPWAIQRVSW